MVQSDQQCFLNKIKHEKQPDHSLKKRLEVNQYENFQKSFINVGSVIV